MAEITTEQRTTRAVGTERRPSVMAVVRGVVVIGGVAALAAGAFLDWIGGTTGDRLAFEAYWEANPGTADTFLTSAAIGMLGVAVLGVIGLAFLSGWPLRLAGALGLAGVLLLFVQMGRADLAIADATDVGLWLCLIGAAILLIAGFIPATRVVTTERRPVDDRAGHEHDVRPPTEEHRTEHELDTGRDFESHPHPADVHEHQRT
ncbi:MAG TPA: hypothetical protein VE669_08650 [Actinomycetota bacterium]|jgi:hypothetical protein|nr:hypothetical protein [Actinomycetota bacterium]